MTKEKDENGIAQMLSESGYSDKAIHYFQTRENIGIIEDADQVTDLTGPCGDTMKISLHIEGDKIDDAKIQVLGCPGAIASGCALMNLAKGKTLKDAWQINADLLYEELEKLPDKKIHCARLAIRTLQKAIEEYEKRSQKKSESKAVGRREEEKGVKSVTPRGQGMGGGKGKGRGQDQSDRGRGMGGGRGLGPGGDCICPECGNKATHKRGTPCFEFKCPKCGSYMTRG